MSTPIYSPGSGYVPQCIDIWDNNKHWFDNKLQESMNKQVHNIIIEYNVSTDIVKPSHDPFPDDKKYVNNRDWALDYYGWEPAKLDFYRTLCRLELEMQYQRKIGRVEFFGFVIDINRPDKDVVVEIAKFLKSYSDKGYILGSLTKLSKMYLADKYNVNTCSKKAVFSYVGLNEEGLYHLAVNPVDMNFQEGGMPKELP